VSAVVPKKLDTAPSEAYPSAKASDPVKTPHVARQSFKPREWPTLARHLSLPTGVGSSDAWMLSQLLLDERRTGPMVVITANPTDAQRLLDEVAWFNPQHRLALFPDWETLAYDQFSPHQDLISERLATLYSLMQGQLDLMVLPASTALHRLAPPSFLASSTFFFKKGQKLDEPALRSQLTTAGYEHVSQVVRPGEYCVRGGLIDLYPMGAALPFRLDLFGDEIESIRTFDPDNQRSLYPQQEVRLLPGREFPLDEPARQFFRNKWRERFEGDPSKCSIYKDIGIGIASAGIEYYLPLFHASSATFFDYLPKGATLLTHGPVESAARQFTEDTLQRYKFLSHDGERPVLTPKELFLESDEFFILAKNFGRFSLGVPGQTNSATGPNSDFNNVNHSSASPTEGLDALAFSVPDCAVDRRAENPIARLIGLLERTTRSVLILAESAGRMETISQLFEQYQLKLDQVPDWSSFQSQLGAGKRIALSAAPLHLGFLLDPEDLILITESELFASSGRRNRRGKREAQTNVDALIKDLSELKIGDPVVHTQHGIGRYQGLINLDLGEGATEFLHLKYAGDATLYVPVAQLHVIGRYSGANPDDAPLHALGSGAWEKAKRRAAQQARDTAAELLNLYARRALRQGYAFKFAPADYELFAEGFGFEETPDQLAAIHAVVQDMTSGKPMDRLVCGDVGFGKTEVALRAAWVAINDGKQVAILCPTTLLAEQHFQTFSDRFSNLPVHLAELSRFRSAKEVKAAIDGLNTGKIDIVIGTHKLLSNDVKFDRLGLVIIDEEHRFGVRQKEVLKNLRAEVDVLTLTATPIPRTLAMSMEGIRDFSVIATAPQKRLAIKTFVRRENAGAIREALLRELKRGGQAYFLHNEVETIENRRQALEKLMPEARIVVAHGQMPERDLERVMKDFHAQKFNVLLCTTIIETGIDVPSANTIVIHRADKFGLAQLHQLRGRVGRSHHQAYAYLMTPDESAITKDAKKRLEAIQSMEELGSGFYLSMHDLEIRGAGEVLGDNQSGDMIEVGFTMYSEMLSEAVKAMKAGKEPDLAAPLPSTTEINLHIPALLPTSFCGDVNERLSLYKRLANTESAQELEYMQEELVDRFGKLPDQARALIESHRLRILGKPLGIAKIDANEESILIQFVPQPPIDPAKIIKFIQTRKDAKLAGPDKLRLTIPVSDLVQRTNKVKEIFKALS
jgi:transcription-repair coupling factor (superfamily II helicase)